MKKNKIIAGAMALMVMACAAPATAVAAGGTVVFSASKETALPEMKFGRVTRFRVYGGRIVK